ncbi:MAG: alpha/beta fold hydrolase [Acidimicrobiia bacterium]|nr:alpha/beta fold hydrolase [Acidimicrobiia bacterium]MBV9041449.1 alpha/beta fold hydrolase [Acidimicrobiia bacterium]
MDGRAQEWFDAGRYFRWQDLEIFHAEFGDPDAPLVALVHGFPTSSIDWYDVAPRLAVQRRVCVLDFPGFGFSDKPRDRPYTLVQDVDLLAYYLGEVIGADQGAVVAHDRGDSVALQFAARCDAGEAAFDIVHLVLSNGNMFLPLSNLTDFQRLVLHDDTARSVLDVVTPEGLAAGMGTTTFTPPRSSEDPAIAALAQTFAYNDGVAVVHDTIQYLVERSENEEQWLSSLSGSAIPTTLLWGLCDTVSPPRVATYIWDTYVSTKPSTNELWFLPYANHYLQHDDPEGFVEVVTRVLDGRSPVAPGALSAEPRAPILVDRSRPELRSAADVLAGP